MFSDAGVRTVVSRRIIIMACSLANLIPGAGIVKPLRLTKAGRSD